MGPITRTCSAIGLALALPALAEARVSPQSLIDYVRGRVATDAGEAAHSLSMALTNAPDDSMIAYRAYRSAVIAGDYRLALRGAQALDRQGRLPSEARLLLLIDALGKRDDRTAESHVAALGRDPALAFIAPQLAEWVGLSRPAAAAARPARGRTNDYAAENAALAALARGDDEAGIAAIRVLWTLDPYRAQSLRLAAAATLAKRKQKAAALKLLVAETRSTRIARDRIERGQRLDIAVDRPLAGIGFILARLSGDLITEGSGTGAVTLARFAQFADPQNARIALSAASALATSGRTAAALAIAEALTGDPLYGDDADSLRIDLLEKLDRHEEAVRAAEARAARSANDAARLGDMAMRRGDFAEAGRRFDAALAMAGRGAAWALWHAAGNAHLLAGDWTRAKPALERALALAPDQPLVMNSLGFGLVDLGGNPSRGKALIERAAELAPGNASIIDSQGWAAYKTGDLPRAIAALERARSLQPVQAEIGEHLGDVYWAAGRRIDARYAWAAARVSADAVRAARLDAKIDRGLP